MRKLQKTFYLLLVASVIIFNSCKQPSTNASGVDTPDFKLAFEKERMQINLTPSYEGALEMERSIKLQHGKDIAFSSFSLKVEDESILTATASENWDTISINPLVVGETTLTVTDSVDKISTVLMVTVTDLDLKFSIEGFHMLTLSEKRSQPDIASDTTTRTITMGSDIALPLTVEGYNPNIISAEVVDGNLNIVSRGKGQTTLYLQDANGVKGSVLPINVRDTIIVVPSERLTLRVGETKNVDIKFYGEYRNDLVAGDDSDKNKVTIKNHPRVDMGDYSLLTVELTGLSIVTGATSTFHNATYDQGGLLTAILYIDVVE